MTQTDRQGRDALTPRQAELNHARAVNRQISLELKAGKAKKRTDRIAPGAALGAIARAQKKNPGNVKAQFSQMLGEVPYVALIGRRRHASDKTQAVFAANIFRAFDELREERAAIRNLGEFGVTHFVVLLKRWIADKNEPATIRGKLSSIRRLLALVGKPNAVPERAQFDRFMLKHGIDPVVVRRTQAAEASKSWDMNGVNPAEVIKQMQGICHVTAAQLEMQFCFGLRVSESLGMCPASADRGDYLLVTDLTKGGRPREVPFDSDQAVREWQRDVLERAKLVSQSHPKRILSIPGRSLQQVRNHFYYRARQVGITRKGLGVTAHGLRHQFAARRYQEMAGIRPPVDGVIAPSEYAQMGDLEHDARMGVTQALGHGRVSVTTAYLGSAHLLSKQARARTRNYIEMLEGNDRVVRLFSKFGVQGCWIGGKAADGLPVAPTESIPLYMRMGDVQDPIGRLKELEVQLQAEISRPFDLLLYFKDYGPTGSLEIHVSPVERDMAAAQMLLEE